MASITLTLSGIKNKDTGKSEILLRYRNTRKVALRAHTRVFVLPKYFVDGDIVINKRVVTPEVRDAQESKITLDRIINHLTEQGNKRPVDEFTPDWAQDTIDRLLYPDNYRLAEKTEPCVMDKVEEYLRFKRISDTRVDTYGDVFGIVNRFELYTGRKLILDKTSAEDLSALEDFIRNEHTLFGPAKRKYHVILAPVKRYESIWNNTPHRRAPHRRSENTIITYMRAIRAYWRWCMDMGYAHNDPFRKYSIGVQKYGTPYYLTTEERDNYGKADLGGDPALELARDIFVFQCYVGCRIGDLLAMTQANIDKSEKGMYLQYIPGKTKKTSRRVVKIYLAPTAIEIMDRHKDDGDGHLFPQMQIWKLNISIREGLEKAGIHRIVTKINPRTGEPEQRPICDVASSHMARRTFIGNLYKKVKDPNLVGKLSGHVEGSQAFARYRDIDDDMIREMTDLLD